MMNLESFEACYESLLPITSTYVDLSAHGARRNEDGACFLTLRLIFWEVKGESREITDIIEQEVMMVRAAHHDSPRLGAYLEGWRDAAQRVFEELPGGSHFFPADLVHPEVLKLVRPQSAEDFCAALLGSKKRLKGFPSNR